MGIVILLVGIEEMIFPLLCFSILFGRGCTTHTDDPAWRGGAHLTLDLGKERRKVSPCCTGSERNKFTRVLGIGWAGKTVTRDCLGIYVDAWKLTSRGDENRVEVVGESGRVAGQPLLSLSTVVRRHRRQ